MQELKVLNAFYVDQNINIHVNLNKDEIMVYRIVSLSIIVV